VTYRQQPDEHVVNEHEGIIFLAFLRYIFEGDITKDIIHLKSDPVMYVQSNSNPLKPNIEATYEDKDLSKGLNIRNFINLQNACLFIHSEIKKDFGLSYDFQLGKLFHKKLSSNDTYLVTQFLTRVRKELKEIC
jgi:hypothetical protein